MRRNSTKCGWITSIARRPPMKSFTTISRNCWNSSSATSAIIIPWPESCATPTWSSTPPRSKQVPACEYFPFEAVKTNIEGPENIVRAIRENKLLRRYRGRHLHRQGLQARQRDGHDQGHPGTGVHHRESVLPENPLRLRALRQRPRVARLGHSALPRPDPQRRAADRDHRKHDPLPPGPRPGRGYGVRGASTARNAAKRTSPASPPPICSTSPAR